MQLTPLTACGHLPALKSRLCQSVCPASTIVHPIPFQYYQGQLYHCRTDCSGLCLSFTCSVQSTSRAASDCDTTIPFPPSNSKLHVEDTLEQQRLLTAAVTLSSTCFLPRSRASRIHSLREVRAQLSEVEAVLAVEVEVVA